MPTCALADRDIAALAAALHGASSIPSDLNPALRPILAAAAGANGDRREVLSREVLARYGQDDGAAILARVARTRPPSSPVVESAADLMARDIPPLSYIVRGLLAPGLAVLAGRPKQGKSWLSLGMGLSIARGVQALGRHTEQGEVLYLAMEDGERRMQTRIRTLLGASPAPRGLHVAYEWKGWADGGAEDLEAWLRAHPACRLVIIDTWPRVAPPPRAKGDAYADTYGTLGQVQGLAQRMEVALVLVTHTRKPALQGGGDYLDAVIGTTATTGCADTIAVLSRDRGQETATLSVTGRDIEEVEIPLSWQDGWEALTSDDLQRRAVEAARREPAVLAVRALVADVGEWTGSAQDLLAELDRRRGPGAPRGDGWPLTPERLGEVLRRHAGAFGALGMSFETCRSKSRRLLTIRNHPGDSGDSKPRRASESLSPGKPASMQGGEPKGDGVTAVTAIYTESIPGDGVTAVTGVTAGDSDLERERWTEEVF